MSKKIIGALIAVALIAITLFFINQKNNAPTEQVILSSTLTISKQYASLRYQTDNVLMHAKNYSSYDEWNSQMTTIIDQWGKLENDAQSLEVMASKMAKEEIGIKIITPIYAYDKQEISNVFDKAPAGKKIATLAKYLGVDAKRAQAILNQDQAQVTADAWNQAGDTLQKLETSAVVIKDGCKVAGFVGTIALTGGTSALASGSIITKAAVVVSGADLALEVTDDGAKIALGNNNKISAIVGEARKVTEPAAAILMIADLPKNLTKGIQKLNAVTFGADQLNTVVQTGSIIGIKLPSYTSKDSAPPMEVSVITPEEIEAWVTDQVGTTKPETIEEIEEILEINQVQEEPEETEKLNDTPKQHSDGGSNDLEGTSWSGTLQNTAGGSQEVFTHEWQIAFQKNGILSGTTGESELTKWKREGNKIFIYKEDMSSGYLEFEISGITLTLNQVVIGDSHITAGEEYMGGKALSGSLVRQ